MHGETGSPAPRTARLTFVEAWLEISQRLAADGRRNPTINAYAHVRAQLGRPAAQSTGTSSADAEIPQDPEAMARVRAARETRPDGRPPHSATRRRQRYIVPACYRHGRGVNLVDEDTNGGIR